MKTSRTAFVFASLAGSLLVHFTLSACSPNASSKTTGNGEASADTPAATCTTWEVQQFMPPSWTQKKLVINGSESQFETFDAFTLPDGWEPMNGDYGPVTARHCKQ